MPPLLSVLGGLGEGCEAEAPAHIVMGSLGKKGSLIRFRAQFFKKSNYLNYD